MQKTANSFSTYGRALFEEIKEHDTPQFPKFL